jgi:hypothetical protein
MDRLGTTTAANRGSRYNKERSYYTQSDIVEQFTSAMLEAGIAHLDAIIGVGNPYRFKIVGRNFPAHVAGNCQ